MCVGRLRCPAFAFSAYTVKRDSGAEASPCRRAGFAEGTAIGGVSVNKLLVKLSMTAAVGGLLCASPALAQMLPPATKAASVAIVQQPTLESAYDDIAFVRWTATTP